MPHVAFQTPSRTLFAVPYWIAAQRGYFAEAGITTSLDIVGDRSSLEHRLRTAHNQISIDTPDSVILDALAGGPTRVIAGNACKPPLFIVARPHIRTLQQLRGATFGVLSLKEGSSKLIPKIAAAAGFSLTELRIIEVGGAPARKQLLLDGQIDVGLQPMPLNYEAEAAGLNNLGWTGTFEPDWQFTTINTNIEWARSRPQLVCDVLLALLEAMQFMRSDPAAAAAISAPELDCAPRFAERAISQAMELGILDLHLRCSQPSLRKILDNLHADGLVPNDAEAVLARSTALEYLEDAIGRLKQG